jgi:hypothetical protein
MWYNKREMRLLRPTAANRINDLPDGINKREMHEGADGIVMY